MTKHLLLSKLKAVAIFAVNGNSYYSAVYYGLHYCRGYGSGDGYGFGYSANNGSGFGSGNGSGYGYEAGSGRLLPHNGSMILETAND